MDTLTHTALMLVALTSILASCTTDPSTRLAPVEEGRPANQLYKSPISSQARTPASAASVEHGSSPRSSPGIDTAQGVPSVPQHVSVPPGPGPAVVALLDTAKRQQSAGQLASAAASLERALRIESQSAWTWYQLAVVRFKQGRLEQAEQLARRSDSLAGKDREVRARNWRLIALIREHQGDRAGAEAARQRAEAVGP